ncbi:hypothetical protein [Brevundimonas aurifodinae]|uniref:DUF1311 domain-containing protein n=2 Tax=Brevundimonas TaxID=41275 RepID=A0ABV1NS26_9CAUL|nr:MAG: hypothetical protein B7Z42_14985 [Brevundimonas sp. 12-68-7]OYX30610.1 MAG: hypothetical protein B7Z01_14065 [Brevundimonas subvibrioides]
MLSLLLAAVIAAPGPQAVQATLQSCAMEGGRWVCRYAVPDIEIVPLPGNDVVADAPAAILGVRPADVPSTGEVAPPAVTVPTTAAAERRTVPLDAGILTEREQRLVARCADAPWYAVCLPDDRRAARTLKEKQDAFLAVRSAVTARLATQDCDGAVKAALDGGYLDLAGQARGFCSAAD